MGAAQLVCRAKWNRVNALRTEAGGLGLGKGFMLGCFGAIGLARRLDP